MLRFIKHNLTTIDGVAIYPIISLLIFVVFFTIVIYRVVKMTKTEIIELSDLPISDQKELEINKTQH